MYNLDGKVALVTGAAGKRGIGRAVAIRLAREGADIAVNDVSGYGVRRTEDDIAEDWHGLEDVVKEVRSLGRKAAAVEADISSAEQVETMVSKCVEKLGKVDILINNAAIIGPRRALPQEITEVEWRRVLDINVVGTYLCTKSVARRMIERGEGGKIVNLASIAGKVGSAGLAPYTASKFAVVGLTQALALELAPYKIYVNAVCPAFTATEISMGASIRPNMRKGMSLEEATARAYGNALRDVPLGRACQPEEVAGVVAFLVSGESDYMTGQAINVTGGRLMCH